MAIIGIMEKKMEATTIGNRVYIGSFPLPVSVLKGALLRGFL